MTQGDNEYIRIWKQTVVACVNFLSQNTYREAEENEEQFSFYRHSNQTSPESSSSSAALQPGVGFGLLYKVIPLLSVSSQLLQIFHLEHFHIFEDSIDASE
jgi:hypothetical protein